MKRLILCKKGIFEEKETKRYFLRTVMNVAYYGKLMRYTYNVLGFTRADNALLGEGNKGIGKGSCEWICD